MLVQWHVPIELGMPPSCAKELNHKKNIHIFKAEARPLYSAILLYTTILKYLPPAYLDTAYHTVAEVELVAAEQDIQPVVDTVDIFGLPI